MPVPFHTPDSSLVGLTCERSALLPSLRLAITFGALFALRLLLPLSVLALAYQVLVLLAAATFFAWQFWWNCETDRRGPIILVGSLWLAGLAKILLQ